MYKGKKILALIPARGGSKSVPGKNLRPVGGKPLLAWTIETAKKSKFIDRLILSSDDDQIMHSAKYYGCEVPFVRPSELAGDSSPTNDVILHAIDNIKGYDLVVALQVTSPLVTEEDIDQCIKKCIDEKAKACVSACEPDKSPYWMFCMEDERLVPVLGEGYLNKRRQELPSVYVPNGAVFVADVKWFKINKSFYSDLTVGYIMPRERSIDLDTEFDFKLLETYLEYRKVTIKKIA